MSSKTFSVNDGFKGYDIDDPSRQFQIIFTSRSPNPLHPNLIHSTMTDPNNPDELAAYDRFAKAWRDMLMLTVRNWRSLMDYYLYDKPLPDDCRAAIDVVNDPETIINPRNPNDDPYCSVWNRDYNDLTFTVTEDTDPRQMLMFIDAHIKARQALIQVARDRLNLDIVLPGQPSNTVPFPPQPKTQEKPQNNPRRIPQDDDQDKKMADLTKSLEGRDEPWVRPMKSGLADGLIAFESGKEKSFAKQAVVAADIDDNLPESAEFMAIPITGDVNVGVYSGDDGDTRYLNIPTRDGNKAIRVYDRGGDHNYDWKKAIQATGFDDEVLVNGLKFTMPADYVVMKVNGEYRNFFGFYQHPSDN